MVEGMSVVVNVMLSLISVMSSPPALYNLSVRTVVKLCTLGVFRELCTVSFLVVGECPSVLLLSDDSVLSCPQCPIV